jgi:endogenous inhibitor of DNA gyrase (YacG/DUF329 family)
MSGKSISQLRCPICKNPVDPGAEDSPFCSERCRTIDLGKWATGQYVIPSPIEEGEEIESLPSASTTDEEDL